MTFLYGFLYVFNKKIDRIQSLNTDSFNRPPVVTNAQCIIGTEKYLNSGILINYADDDYSQGYRQIKETFRALTKDDILNPFKSDHAFGSTNVNNAGEDDDVVGYNLCAFDIRYQINLESAQPINVEFKFSENIPAGIYGYALVLTNKLENIGSDCQRHFDLI